MLLTTLTILLISTLLCYLTVRNYPHGGLGFERYMLMINILSLVAFPVILALNLRVVRQLSVPGCCVKSNTSENQLRSSARPSTTRGTVMVLGMTCLFLVLKAPQVICTITWYSIRFDWLTFAAISMYMNCLASVKLWIAVFLIPNFRQDLITALTCGKYGHGSKRSSRGSSSNDDSASSRNQQNHVPTKQIASL